MIKIVAYRADWPDEFQVVGKKLRAALGPLAVRIDHIGSTSVPGLAAKDLIDIQVTVAEFTPAAETALDLAGLRRAHAIAFDHIPPGESEIREEWTKWMYYELEGERPVHVHVRQVGRANQRYPLLFRDYLRSHSDAAQAYAQIKTALAVYHANDVDAYYAVKDPVCDLIIQAAEIWAAQIGWQPGPSDC